jgi:hypothetical protein
MTPFSVPFVFLWLDGLATAGTTSFAVTDA